MAGMLNESQKVCMYAGDAVCPIAVLLSEFTIKLDTIREICITRKHGPLGFMSQGLVDDIFTVLNQKGER